MVGFIYTRMSRGNNVGTEVKKRIFLPPKLAKEVEDISRAERKPLSTVIQEALRLARKERNKKKFYQVQDYWSRKAKEKRILTEKDLERYLKTSENKELTRKKLKKVRAGLKDAAEGKISKLNLKDL